MAAQNEAISTSAKGSGRAAVGHPVDVATGTLFDDFEDYVLPGQVPLVLGRRHSSALVGQQGGLFGPGWFCAFEMWLRRDLDGFRMLDRDGETEIVFDDPDGQVDRGGVVRELGSFHEIAFDGQAYVVTRWDPDADDLTHYVFAPPADGAASPLIAILDGTGQGMDILRDAAGRVERIVQRREGRGLRLVHDDMGRVAEARVMAPQVLQREGRREVVDSERRVLRYAYDGAGRLAGMADALGQTCRYAYDPDGYLVRETNLAGMVYTFRYDDRRRCIETTGASGYGLNALDFDPEGGITRVTDALGEVTTYQWNASGQIERETSPLGHTQTTAYDDHGRIVARTDANGATTAYAYDERGDRITVTAPAGAETHYAYDHGHRLTTVTDPEGHLWQRRYDEAGRVSAVVNPLGDTLAYEYNGSGDLTAIADPGGNRTAFHWDAFGNLTAITDPLGHATRYEYAREGQLTAVVDAKGFRTRAKLDALGRVTEVILPDGARRRFAWNAYDQITEYTDELGAKTRWRYEHCGVPAEVVRPHGGRIRFDWSPVPGRLLAVTNEHGERYRFEYDPAGNLTRETDFGDRQTAYEVDPAGQVAAIVDAAGRRTELHRNADGAVTQIQYEDSATVFDYDPRGLLIAADNGQCPVERRYDPVGRLVYERQGEHEVFSEYDGLGNRIRRRSSLGYETEFAWNANYQLTRLMPKGFAPLHFEYDERQDETARFVEGGVRITQAYDARGRRIEQKVTAGGATQPGHAAVGERAIVHRRYTYDATSNLTRLMDSNWGATDYTYDAIGRILSADLPGKLSERFEYDLADNIVSMRRSQRVKGQRQMRETDETCRYAKGNTLLRKGDTEYEYDALGQLVRKSNGEGTMDLRWNQAGQLVGAVLADGSEWRYEYDPFWRRTRKVGSQETVEFVWEGDVVLHERRERLNVDDALAAQIVSWEFESDSFTPVEKIEEHTRHLCINHTAGNPGELVSETGTVLWANYYRAWGDDLDMRAAHHECPIRLQGQVLDKETSLCQNRFRYYSPEMGRFISLDPIGLLGGPNRYAYSPNIHRFFDPLGLTWGRPVSWPSPGKVSIDMEEVLSGHTVAGERAIQSGKKDLFPEHMTPKQIERAIRRAYRKANQRLKVRHQPGGVRHVIRGDAAGLRIEMWYNHETKTIETAYPKGLSQACPRS